MSTAVERAWSEIERAEPGSPGVTPGTGFGRDVGLRIGGKVFAVRLDDAVVVKLPRDRVEELVAAGVAERWGPGNRVMKEWVAIPEHESARWQAVVAESRLYVAAD